VFPDQEVALVIYEMHFRMILKIILKKKGTSSKLQAASFKLDNGSWIL
jgi:hypothetical protein